MSRVSFRILCLDGGGSKGVYTLGVLHELEQMLGGKLYQHFDLIYGVSTGSIIGSCVALGEEVKIIESHYFELIPEIMGWKLPSVRTAKFKKRVMDKYGDRKFEEFLTDVGIIATNKDDERPLIFKRSTDQAYSLKSTFAPGYGCTIAEAILASCAAYPFFEKIKISTKNQGDINTIDGGFVANNPVLFSLIDATQAYRKRMEDIRILSIGTGQFPENKTFLKRILIEKTLFHMIPKMFNYSSNTMDLVGRFLFPDLKSVRVNDSFTGNEYQTGFLDNDINRLKRIRQLGRDSFSKKEKEIKLLLSD